MEENNDMQRTLFAPSRLGDGVQPLVVLSMWLCLLLPVSQSQAAPVFLYNAPQNPTTMGFLDRGGVFSGTGSANTAGLPAWVVTGDGCCGYYYTGVTTNLVNELYADGWSMTARFMLLGTSGEFAGVTFDPGSQRRFDLQLQSDDAGRTSLVLFDGMSRATSPTIPVDARVFHDYTLAYRPGSQAADVFIDGLLVYSGYRGNMFALEGRGLLFGSFAGPSSPAAFSLVRLDSSVPAPSPVPEPSSLSLFSLAAIAGGLKKLRSRPTRKAASSI